MLDFLTPRDKDVIFRRISKNMNSQGCVFRSVLKIDNPWGYICPGVIVGVYYNIDKFILIYPPFGILFIST